MFKRLIASLVCLTFSFSNLQYVHAQDFSINQLPLPGTMVGKSVPFAPLALKGLIVNPQKPLEFQFIVDTGRGPQDIASIKDQANQLVKYFLAGLTIPEGDLWVNLSPYEKNRMVPEALGQTDLGRDLLAQDYILKQLTASLIYPEKDLGKEFWSRVYSKAQAQFGTTNIPVHTFNKVWILPDQAQVFENVNAAYVTKSTLKVMLDEDYLAISKHPPADLPTVNQSAGVNPKDKEINRLGSQIVREIVLPEIEKEVNTGKNFAPLRQIYQALILAKWYKETIQNALLDALYTNKKKIAGVNVNDPAVKEQIYERYLKAYKKGAFNYIKEDPTPDGQVMPRKYFSGGEVLVINLKRTKDPAMVGQPDGAMISIRVMLNKLFQIFKGEKAARKEALSPVNNEDWINQRSVGELIEYLGRLPRVKGEQFYTGESRFYDEHIDIYASIIQRLKSLGEPAVEHLIDTIQLRPTGDYGGWGGSLALSARGSVAITVLGDIGNELAVPRLLWVVNPKESRYDVFEGQKLRAVDALRKIGGEAVISGLIKVRSKVMRSREGILLVAIDMALSKLMLAQTATPNSRVATEILNVLAVVGDHKWAIEGVLLHDDLRRELIKSIQTVKDRYSSDAGIVEAANRAVARIKVDQAMSNQMSLESVNLRIAQIQREMANAKIYDVTKIASLPMEVEDYFKSNYGSIGEGGYVAKGESYTVVLDDGGAYFMSPGIDGELKSSERLEGLSYLRRASDNPGEPIIAEPLVKISPDGRYFKIEDSEYYRVNGLPRGIFYKVEKNEKSFQAMNELQDLKHRKAEIDAQALSQETTMIISEDAISQYLRTDFPSPDQFEQRLRQAASRVSYTRHDLEVVQDLSGVDMYSRFGTKMTTEEYWHEGDVQNITTIIVDLGKGNKVGVVFDAAMFHTQVPNTNKNAAMLGVTKETFDWEQARQAISAIEMDRLRDSPLLTAEERQAIVSVEDHHRLAGPGSYESEYDTARRVRENQGLINAYKAARKKLDEIAKPKVDELVERVRENFNALVEGKEVVVFTKSGSGVDIDRKIAQAFGYPFKDKAMIISEDAMLKYLRAGYPSSDQFEEWLHQEAPRVSYTRHDLGVVQDLSGVNMYSRFGTKMTTEEYWHEGDVQNITTIIVDLGKGNKVGVVFDAAMSNPQASNTNKNAAMLIPGIFFVGREYPFKKPEVISAFELEPIISERLEALKEAQELSAHKDTKNNVKLGTMSINPNDYEIFYDSENQNPRLNHIFELFYIDQSRPEMDLRQTTLSYVNVAPWILIIRKADKQKLIAYLQSKMDEMRKDAKTIEKVLQNSKPLEKTIEEKPITDFVVAKIYNKTRGGHGQHSEGEDEVVYYNSSGQEIYSQIASPMEANRFVVGQSVEEAIKQRNAAMITDAQILAIKSSLRQKKEVLFVEDNPIDMELAKQYFKRLPNLTFHYVGSLEEARQIITEHGQNLGLVITDNGYYDKKDFRIAGFIRDAGVGLTRDLSKQFPNLPVILTSGIPVEEILPANASFVPKQILLNAMDLIFSSAKSHPQRPNTNKNAAMTAGNALKRIKLEIAEIQRNFELKRYQNELLSADRKALLSPPIITIIYNNTKVLKMAADKVSFPDLEKDLRAAGLNGDHEVLLKINGNSFTITNAAMTAKEGKTILVVDDDQSVRDSKNGHYRSYGYQVRLASNGQEALEMVKAHPDISWVDSDLEMPGMNGIELAIALNKLNPKLPVTISTGSLNSSDIDKKTEIRKASPNIKEVFSKPGEMSESVEYVDARLHPNAAMLERLFQNRQLTVVADDDKKFQFHYIDGFTVRDVPVDDYFSISVSHDGQTIGHIDVKGNVVDLSFEWLDSMVYRDIGFESKGQAIGYRGVGRTLLALAMGISRLKGNHRFVASDVTNPYAEKLYSGLGFSKSEWDKKAWVFDLISHPLPIIKIEKMQDHAMLEQIPKRIQKAIAEWELTGDMNGIMTVLNNNTEWIRQDAMDTIDDKFKADPEKKLSILKTYLYQVSWHSPDDVVLRAMKEIDRLVTDPEKKLPILEGYLQSASYSREDIVLWVMKEIDRLVTDPDKKLRILTYALSISNSQVNFWAMKEIDRLVPDPEKKIPILRQALGISRTDSLVRLWAMKEIDRLVADRQDKLSILVSPLAEMERNRMYDEYNEITDFLNKLGYPEGNSFYSFESYTGQDQEQHRMARKLRRNPLKKSEPNKAMNGGIDLNQINVLRNGKTVNVQFDPAQLIQLEQGGFEGFTPVIVNMTRISNPFQLLGINAPQQEVQLVKA